MPQPTQQDVHVDAILTSFSIAYMQKADKFIAQKVFPVIPVDKQSDLYFIFDKDAWFRDEAEKRADATESAGSGYTVSTTSYLCDVWALHKDIGDQTRKNTDAPLDPDRNATQFVTQRLMIRQEKQWTSDYFKDGVWNTDYDSTEGDFTAWNDFAGSDPIEDIEMGKEVILGTTGFDANKLVLGYQTFRKLRNHPDIVDRIKYTSAEVVTEALLAKYFGVDEVLVARAIINTAVEGQTGSYSFIYGKAALLLYANPAPALEQPSAGYIFTWKGVSDGLGTNIGISRFRMQHLRADRVEGQIAWTNKVVGTDLGVFYNNAVT